jgi:protein-disulfide isomerase
MKIPGIVVGPGGVADAPGIGAPSTRVDLFVDYMCPFCRRFDTGHGAEVQAIADAGTAHVVVHPLAFLDRLSNGTEYSTRAAGAAFAVASRAPGAFGVFHAALFANQPPENSAGLDNAELARLARSVGASDNAVRHLADPEYKTTAAEGTRAAIDLGVQGTPTVLVSRAGVGQVLWDGIAAIADLVEQLSGE